MVDTRSATFLSTDLVGEFLSIGRRRRIARREVLFHEGDPADSFHVVVKGRAAVRVATSLGSTVTLDVIGPGAVVGELAVLLPGRRSATVAALEVLETMEVRADAFAELRTKRPDAVDHLLQVVAERNRQLVGRLAEVTSVSAAGRVRRRLVEVAELYGAEEATPVVPLTQDDLASLAATTRETVNRVLRVEAAAGCIELARGRVLVVDLDALRARSGQP